LVWQKPFLMREMSIHEREMKVKICDEINWLNRKPV